MDVSTEDRRTCSVKIACVLLVVMVLAVNIVLDMKYISSNYNFYEPMYKPINDRNTSLSVKGIPPPLTDGVEECVNCEHTTPRGNLCMEQRRPNKDTITTINNLWQELRFTIHKQIGSIFTTYSYYDDRPVLNGSVMIRTFVVTTGYAQTWLSEARCYLWLEHAEHPVIVKAYLTGSNGNRKIRVRRKNYRNYIVSCDVPRDIAENQANSSVNITHISFTTSKIQGPCPEPMLYVPVIYPEKPKYWIHTVGMCEANGVSFGYLDDTYAPWLTEWFEANMMFGITELNLYNATMQVAPSVQKVLNYYQEKGVLKFHQHPPPIDPSKIDPFNRDMSDLGMRTSLNDCFYRNMYRYKYIAGIDIDELLVPYKHNNYTEMFKYLELEYRDHNFTQSFRLNSAPFYKSFTGERDLRLYSKYPLKTAQYLYHVFDIRRPKTFFNPRVCLCAFSHYCLKKIPDAPKVAHQLSRNIALVHHYRNVCLKNNTNSFSYAACKQQEHLKRVGDRMIYFQEDLFKRMSMVAKELKINFQ